MYGKKKLDVLSIFSSGEPIELSEPYKATMTEANTLLPILQSRLQFVLLNIVKLTAPPKKG